MSSSVQSAAGMRFRDRAHAGRVLARPLLAYAGRDDVASAETCDEFRADVDEIVCALTPSPFHAVGLWYDDFSQTSDEEVRELLRDSSDDEEAG